MNFKFAFFRKFDWLLFLSSSLLTIIGLVAIYSTDLAKTELHFADFKRQLIVFLLGLLFLFLLSILNFRQARNARNLLYWLGAAMLLAVLVFGATLRGTTGWFVFGPLNFQPSEVAKIILVIFLAAYFSEEGRNIFSFFDVIKSFLAAAIFIILVLYQPDLGSAFILFLVWLGMLLSSRIQKKHLLILLAGFLVLSAVLWFFLLAPYQKDRLKIFLNPGLDPLFRGYNIKQSIIAIGSGGFWGRGLGYGSQSQLRFLPESQTDFIFAMIAEEMGFLIVVVVLALFILLFFRILKIIKQGLDDFPAYLGIGFLIIFFSESFINIGMNLGLAPVTGVALPLVSLGGSSLLSKFMMIGILESIKLRE